MKCFGETDLRAKALRCSLLSSACYAEKCIACRTFLTFMENQICKRTQCPYQEKVQCDLQRNELFTKRK